LNGGENIMAFRTRRSKSKSKTPQFGKVKPISGAFASPGLAKKM